jgi:hypothetical protein
MTRKTSIVFLAICAILFLGGKSLAQSRSTLEDQAYDYLNNSEFVKAYEAFDQLHARYPKELDYEFKLGICALGYPEKKDSSWGSARLVILKRRNAPSRYSRTSKQNTTPANQNIIWPAPITPTTNLTKRWLCSSPWWQALLKAPRRKTRRWLRTPP